jgi:cystathionine beta-lyase
MYDFDRIIDRSGTGSVKWEAQHLFGVPDGLLPFWIADTDFETLPEIIQAIRRRLKNPMLGYTFPPKTYLEAVRGWQERRHGWKIDASWVVPGPGVMTGLSLAIRALTQPGDQILLFSPVYDPFYKVIESSNRTLADLHLARTGNTWEIDFEKLERKLAAGVKAIILCNPHNPVGRVWSVEELGKIARLCRKYGVHILSDDIHGDFELFENVYTPIASLPEARDITVTFSSISKTFNMAGLGASNLIIARRETRRRVAGAMKDAFIFGPNAIALTAIEAAYTHGDAYVNELNAYLEKNVAFAGDYFSKNMPGVGVTKLEGTFLMWLDFGCLGLTCAALSEVMARRHGIALSPGIAYGKQSEGFMRLNIGCPRSMLEKGLTEIHTLYERTNGRTGGTRWKCR